MGLTGRLFKRRPAWVDRLDPATTPSIDVRAVIAAGEEPLHALMERARDIPPGDGFIIDAPFDPVPLRRVFARMGFNEHGEEIAPHHWRVWFRREAGAGAPGTDGRQRAARIWHGEDGWHIDVRGLEPPEPMHAIVTLIETPAIAGPVFIHHERDPVYLYPELAERGWRASPVAGEPGEVRLRLDKEAP